MSAVPPIPPANRTDYSGAPLYSGSRSSEPFRTNVVTPDILTTTSKVIYTTPKYHASPSSELRPLKTLPLLSWNKVLTDDFCHNKFLTAKWKYYNRAGVAATLQGKQVLLVKSDEKGKVNALVDSVGSWCRLSTNIDKYLLEARFWNNGRLRLFLDSPFLDKERSYNFFATARSNVEFNSWKLSSGFNYLGQHCRAMTRLWANDKQDVVLDEKTILKHGKWFSAIYLRLFLKELRLSRYDFVLGYQDRDFDVYLSHESTTHDRIALGALTASLVYRYDRFNVAAQVRNEARGDSYALGVHYNANDNNKIKVKFDDKLDLTTAWRVKLNTNYSLVVGAQFRFAQGAKTVDFSKVLPFPLGFVFEATL